MSIEDRMQALLEGQSSSDIQARMGRLLEAQPPAPGQHSPAEFDQAFKKFLHAAQQLADDGKGSYGEKKIAYESGPKFIRVFKQDIWQGKLTNTRSAYCFVDKATGDIYKAASWKQRAKGVRGNIFANNPVAGVTAHGAVYWR
jgi:hypothetical protein